MTGILEFGGIWKKRQRIYAAPAYWVLRTYANAEPNRLLSVDSDSPTYTISKGVTRLPEIANVPYLDVVAAESKDRTKLLLLCVNRHLTRTLTAKIDLRSLGITDGSAKITTIAGENILTENDEEDPQRVVPVTHTRQLGGDLDYTFPNASITVMEIPVKN